MKRQRIDSKEEYDNLRRFWDFVKDGIVRSRFTSFEVEELLGKFSSKYEK